MNNSKVLTAEKIMLPIRLAPEVYKKMRSKVNLKKEDVRGYSINEYLTDLITKDLQGENSSLQSAEN